MVWIFSGIENDTEIYSCTQLEAQQELAKAIENTSNAEELLKTDVSSENTFVPKVIKKDNIVLGINDLKQQQHKKAHENKKISKTESNNTILDKAKEKPFVTAIKVNNCEILSGRPHSVTAAIFDHPTILYLNKKKGQDKTFSILKKPVKQVFRPVLQGIPTSVTSTIFAPRTKDMNSGYLMYSEETDSGLTSKCFSTFRMKWNFAKKILKSNSNEILSSIFMALLAGGFYIKITSIIFYLFAHNHEQMIAIFSFF